MFPPLKSVALVLKAVEQSANYMKPQDFRNIFMNILPVMKLLWIMHFLDVSYVKKGK